MFSSKMNIALMLLSAGAMLSSVVWAAEPAQIPLTSRVSAPPTANAMITIDDSGSMLSDFMPEGNFALSTWPTKTINLADDWIGGFPGDQRKTVPPPGLSGNFLDGAVTGLKGSETLYQKQYRSPDINAIYYNPDLRYLPWYKSDGSGARMANASPSAARWDPVVSTGTFQLDKNYTGSGGLTAVWYTAYNSHTSSSKKDFYPALVYRLRSKADPTLTASYDRYDLNTNGEHSPATKHVNRTDCAGAKCTQAEERQNFANWFTYYRMRESLTKAAVSETLVDFKDKLRVGWARINKINADKIDGVDFTRIETNAKGGPIRQLDSTRLPTILTGVQGITSWPSTPLRVALNEVGRYFDVGQRGDAGSPWLTNPDPNSGSKKVLSCRRSVNLMMTDGYYNDTYTAAGNVDNADGVNYVGKDIYGNEMNPYKYTPTQYTAVLPYKDSYSNTLADIASYYFKRDLDVKNAPNKVAPITGDIAYWQHLTQFMVGLGVKGTLDSSSPVAKADTLTKITKGALAWPNPCSSCTAEKIDDMWHAAVNTGGDFYSVSNVTELTTALKAALGKAAGAEAKEAGVATASATIVANNVKYVPKYKSVSWYGDLESWTLNADGETEGTEPTWKASVQLPAHGLRNLFTWNGTSSVEFKWASIGLANQNILKTEDLLNYVRGDPTHEIGVPTHFRERTGQYLGDFVNSPPVVVQGLVDLGYSPINSSYVDYVELKKKRTDSLIMLGSNDGILHAFRGKDLKEVYGYLPQQGLAKLPIIASIDYGTSASYHTFVVDGPVSETDAYIKTPGNGTAAWSNIIIGSMGAGGKAFFALHIPTTTPTSLDSNTLMWEVSGAADKDVGYMFADFAVGKVKGGGWKAFVGNGVYSTNGKAVLMVVNMETGAIEKKITVDASSNNGLMGVSLVKDDATKEVVAAYAGDLKGNVWRFDFAGGNASDWDVGFKGKPLFTATDASGVAQPITVPPVFVPHSIKGRVVLVGTGRLIDSVDSDTTSVQTFYGVWDNVKIGDSSLNAISPFDTYPMDRVALQPQIASTTPQTGKAGTFYEVTSNTVNWETQLGWYMDLPFSGQRVVYPSIVLNSDFVLISSIVPAPVAAECESTNGLGYNYILGSKDGAAATVPIFDTDGDGDVDGDDLVVAGFKSSSDGRDAILTDSKDDTKLQECNTENECKVIKLPDDHPQCDPNTESCAVIIKDRIWKQIVSPPTP